MARPDDPARPAAVAASLQRFELGEGGDGRVLLAKAEAAGDPVYTAALRLFVAEEQGHSALFARCLERLEHPRLRSHWSDAAFVALRRAMGLRRRARLSPPRTHPRAAASPRRAWVSLP